MNRARAFALLRVAVVLLVLVLAAVALSSQWRTVGPQLRRLSAGNVVLALLAGCAAIGCAVPSWRALLAEVEPGVDLPWRPATRVFLLGQLGKFVPGSVWVVVAQTELGRRHGVPRRATATAGLLAMGVSLATAVVAAAAFLPLASTDLRHRFWWLSLVAVAALAALAPPVLTPVVAWALRLLRREPLAASLSWGGVGRAVAWSLAGWLLYGVHTLVLVRALGAAGDGLAARSVGGFALALAVGFVVVIAPAGAGVREPLLVLVFDGVLPSGGAIAFAAVSRLLLTVADLLGGGVSAILGRGSDKTGATPSTGPGASRPSSTDPVGGVAAGRV